MSIPGHDTKGLPIFSDADVASQPDPVWLVDGLLTEQSLGAMFGPSGCGKTFVGLDLAFSIATGRPFHGHQVEKGRVVYVYAEGSRSLKLRVFALKKERGIPFDEECGVFFVPRAVDLVDSPDGYDELVEAIEKKGITDVSLVIIDTLAACFGTGDENNTQAMNTFTRSCSEIRHYLKATVFVVHHTGWQNEHRERGSKSLRNNLDAVWGCSMKGGVIGITSVKQRDGIQFNPLQFQLCEVELNDRTSSLVLRQSDAPQQVTNDADDALLRCLHGFGTIGATNGDWMDASAEAPSSFYRRRKGLLKDCLVCGPDEGDSKGFRYTLTDLGREQIGADQSQEKVELLPQISSLDDRTVPQQSHVDSAEVCTKHDDPIIVLNSPTGPSNGTGPHGGASRAPRGTDRDWTEAEDDAEVFACMDCLRALLAGYDSCRTCSEEVARV